MRHLILLTLLVVVLPCTEPAQAIEHDPLHIGVFPRRTATVSRQMFEPLARHLSAQLGRPVVLHTPVDYRAFWHAIEQDHYDLVHYNQYHYVRAHHAHGHRLMAMNEERGRSEIRAIVLVNEDTPYRSLADLRGKKILFGGDRSAMVSYIMTVDMLRAAGLDDADYIARFAQNPLKAVIALSYAQGDAAAAGDAALPLLTAALGGRHMRVLARSAPLPQLPWAASPRLDERQLVQIRDILLRLGNNDAGQQILAGMHLSAFLPIEDEAYDTARAAIARVLGEHY